MSAGKFAGGYTVEIARLIKIAKKEAKEFTSHGKKHGGAISMNMVALAILLNALDPLLKEYKKSHDWAFSLAKQAEQVLEDLKKAGMSDEAEWIAASKATDKLYEEYNQYTESLFFEAEKYAKLIDKIVSLVEKTESYIKHQLKGDNRQCPFCNGQGILKSLRYGYKDMLIELAKIKSQAEVDNRDTLG